MKKIFVLLLMTIMLTAMVACATEKNQESDLQDMVAETEKTETEKVETKAAEIPQETTAPIKEMSFQELTVIDDEYCVIKVTRINSYDSMRYKLNVYLENKSDDTAYSFWTTSSSVNGVQTGASLYAEVAPGETSYEFIDFNLEQDIGEFSDIELTFGVYAPGTDPYGIGFEPVTEATVHVYPYGEENATVFSRELLDTDTVILDNDAATVVVTGYEYDQRGDYHVNLFVANKSDENVTFDIDNVSVNGYTFQKWSYGVNLTDDLLPGNCTFSFFSLPSGELVEKNISDVESIDFVLTMIRCDDFNTLMQENVTLNP